MKIRQRSVAILAAAFILSGSFPMHVVRADQTQDDMITTQDSAAADDGEVTDGTQESSAEIIANIITEGTEAASSSSSATEISEEAEAASSSSSAAIISEEAALASSSGPTAEIIKNTDTASPETAADEGQDTETAEDTEDMLPSEPVADYPIPDEPPAFHAHIEYWMGYTVIGTFTDFTPDIVSVDTLYSLDGESWRAVTGGDWNLSGMCDDIIEHKLYDQPCVYNAYEPMKSYTSGDIDRFYLKLRITRQNGLFYDTQIATIEHGGIQSIPDGINRYACFSSGMIAREPDPDSSYRFRMYGRYQITIPADATAEDVSALLPETLPVEVQLYGRNFKVNGVVECPVTWKSLSLPQFSAGETITIPDAAEDIIVPAGTLLTTPLGTFELDEPISVDSPPCTDEVRLVLNVSLEERNLTGVLKRTPDGLSVALHQKPAGAVSIEAYVMTEGASEWTEIPGRALLKEMNAQQSTENSGFALVLYNDQEPYRSYLEAQKAGTESTPFFIGLKINGGIYDGRQLILAWPDVYEEIPDLPRVGRSEGNEGNAGAANKDDSTEGGQRPNLPKASDDGREKQTLDPPQMQSDKQERQETASVVPESQNTLFTDVPVSVPIKSEEAESGQRPNLPRITQDTVDDVSYEERSDPADEEGSSVMQPLDALQAADKKDDENTLMLSNAEAAVGRVAEKGSSIPILPAAVVVAAGSCIGVAACSTTAALSAGYNALARIVGKIRYVLRR